MSLIDNALREVEYIQREINRLFSRVGYTPGVNSFPLMNLYENDDELIVMAETPGLKKEDITINVTENMLTLSGVCHEKDYGDDVEVLRNERAKGGFEKSFRIPLKIEKEQISAFLADGILTVKLLKAAEAKPRKIMIEV